MLGIINKPEYLSKTIKLIERNINTWLNIFDDFLLNDNLYIYIYVWDVALDPFLFVLGLFVKSVVLSSRYRKYQNDDFPKIKEFGRFPHKLIIWSTLPRNTC